MKIWVLMAVIMIMSCNKSGSDNKADTNIPPALAASSTPEVQGLLGQPDPIANPNALPGGTYTGWGSSFPKSLNMFLDLTSFNVEVMGLMFESLIGLHSTENKFTGHLAESWEVSSNKMVYTFKIRPQARWSDGKSVTAGDFQFYYDVMMNPANLTSVFRVGLKRFERPVVVDSQTLQVTAKESHWQNLGEAGGLVAFPRHIWEGKDFNKQNFEFPVVSGPYMLEEVKKPRYIRLKRRSDWWGRALSYNAFKYNFSFIKYKFINDRNKSLEAFKKGEMDIYAIYTSSIWMKKTNFDQVKNGWVVRQKIYNKEPKGYQGLAINLRKPKFKDKKVRLALAYLLNRQQMNEKLMFNQYFLLNSFYPDLYPGNVNPAVPIIPFNPDSARALLKSAGWRVDDKGSLVKDGEYLDISFLTAAPDLRHLNIYLEDLKQVGIHATIEQLSWSSLQKRMQKFDYDMYWSAWGAGRLRDPEAAWHSSTANEEASNNYPGVEDKIVDSLIEVQKAEMSIDKRNEILKALDKRLLEIVPYVFLWQSDHTRLLYWNKFGTPQYVLDKFNREDAVTTYWWLDQAKDKHLQEAMSAGQALPLQPAVITYGE